MKIIIPMSGYGERFRRVGYTVPKPLIVVEGKPIIQHVVEMFGSDEEFIFICSNAHLANPEYRMREILKSLGVPSTIVGIEPHSLGPVHAVKQVQALLESEEPVIVNYCDFTCYWNWDTFKEYVTSSGVDGCIPCYKGFHPHSLGDTNYAYLREKNGIVLDIKEKEPFTDDRMEEYASSGTYYFKSAHSMYGAFNEMNKQGLSLNGEYYVSLSYKPLLESGSLITVYPLQHFMQWGTPQDVSEYNWWSGIFHSLVQSEGAVPAVELEHTIVVPMAGLGKRFSNEGYVKTKPLIEVSGKPMVLQSLDGFSEDSNYVFVIRRDMLGLSQIKEDISSRLFNSNFVEIDTVTNGQATSAKFGVDTIRSDNDHITVVPCDGNALFNSKKLAGLIESADLVVWGIRGLPNAARNPNMYGWLQVVADDIIGVSVKTPINEPSGDPIIIGSFTFRNKSIFTLLYESLIERQGKVNGEFYLDSLIDDAINHGLVCKYFEIDAFISWGTPNDLKTFEYWQSCFHKWKSHPYSIERDRRFPNMDLSKKLHEIYTLET